MISGDDQPDYGASEYRGPALHRIVRDLWIEGDDDERREADRIINSTKRAAMAVMDDWRRGWSGFSIPRLEPAPRWSGQGDDYPYPDTD